MKGSYLLLLLAIFFTTSLFASKNPPNDSTEQRHYTTKRLAVVPPTLDGTFDDPCWEDLPWSGDFITRAPQENEIPQQKTAFKLTYDDKFIYVAIRCFDTEPEKIVRRLTRRDRFDGDWVEINIDSYNDKRTAFSFTVNAAGVIGDEFITNNGNNWDSNWNPIWYVKTQVDEEGWTAEMRIPLSQLRYGQKDNHEWGLQLTRYDFRNQERSVWQFISRNTAGWVSNFGKLDGIKGIQPQKQVEIQPYVLAKTEVYEAQEGNPYATGNDANLSVGLDAKIGVTSDLTLDLTVNPDFGQVEADPSVLNLDGYQVFFSERRPFFIENRNIFDFQVSYAEAGGPFTRDNVFYSRRIGSSPSGYPNTSDNEFVNMPQNTSILGAAKFSGKTKNGTSIGILESVTQREVALITNNVYERNEIVEPLTNYFVGRIQQDFKEGNSYVGGIFTAVNRNLEDSYLTDFMHESAYTSAIDFMHRWKNQSYYFAGTALFSTVNGTETAITNTQTDFIHNMQRTDADHLTVNENTTSLSGHGGTLRLGKIGGNFKFEGGFTWRSPGLELNDVGFLRQTDYLAHYLWVGYREIEQSKYLNNWRVNYNHWFFWDFSGRNTHQGFNVNAHAQLKNFWGGGMGSFYQHYDVDTRALRGGPSLLSPKGINHWFYVYTDSRKNLNAYFNGWQFWGEKNSSYSQGISIGLNWQPLRTMSVSLSPDYNRSNRVLQYVTNLYDTYNGEEQVDRYVNASINQQTLGLSIRINYTVKPNMTIQLYGQPFISRGDYTDFKYIANPSAEDFNDRYSTFTDKQIAYNTENFEYAVDENIDGTIDYHIYNPNFKFVQFRSNLVYRWEYIPGSTLFLVWSQGTTYYDGLEDPMHQPIIPDLWSNVFNNKGQNIFLIKATYRFLN